MTNNTIRLIFRKYTNINLHTDTEDVDQAKIAEVFAKLFHIFDDRSLSLIMRNARNDGRAAVKLLRSK